METRRRNTERGFTLAEIVIAVLVLSAALVTMIGLQSASVERTLRDQQRQRAMLAARAVMAAIEAHDDPEEQQVSGKLREVMAKVPPLDSLGEIATPEFENLDAELEVKKWDIPVKGVEPGAVKRVHLRIFWSESPQDSFELLFFVPKGSGI